MDILTENYPLIAFGLWGIGISVYALLLMRKHKRAEDRGGHVPKTWPATADRISILATVLERVTDETAILIVDRAYRGAIICGNTYSPEDMEAVLNSLDSGRSAYLRNLLRVSRERELISTTQTTLDTQQIDTQIPLESVPEQTEMPKTPNHRIIRLRKRYR